MTGWSRSRTDRALTAFATWDPAAYMRIRGLRLRPALDLLARIPDDLPPGPIVDLGAGSGMAAPALAARFTARELTAVESSAARLEDAEGGGHYARLTLQDLADWAPDTPPALIFSNAALHGLSDHARLMPRLARTLCPGGVLAVQMPRQFEAPANRLLRQTALALFADRFDFAVQSPPVAAPALYATWLGGLGMLDLWETAYFQTLAAAENAHPVRLFVASTTGRPVVERLSARELETFWQAYDAALAEVYPPAGDGSVTFAQRRLFFVLRRAA